MIGSVAQSSPVYVEVEGVIQKTNQATLTPFFTALEEMRDWAVNKANCPTDSHRSRLVRIFETAQQELTRR